MNFDIGPAWEKIHSIINGAIAMLPTTVAAGSTNLLCQPNLRSLNITALDTSFWSYCRDGPRFS